MRYPPTTDPRVSTSPNLDMNAGEARCTALLVERSHQQVLNLGRRLFQRTNPLVCVVNCRFDRLQTTTMIRQRPRVLAQRPSHLMLVYTERIDGRQNSPVVSLSSFQGRYPSLEVLQRRHRSMLTVRNT